jgi:hypothetical protein
VFFIPSPLTKRQELVQVCHRQEQELLDLELVFLPVELLVPLALVIQMVHPPERLLLVVLVGP